MNSMIKISSLFLILFPCALFALQPAPFNPKTTQLNFMQVTPYISIRSQGVDIADELAGWTNHVNLFDLDKVYGSLAIKPKYTRSFNSNKLCECLFGISSCSSPCGCNLQVSGSRVADRGNLDLLADYFYLSPDFQSTLHFNPRIENVGLDLNFYVGLDEWVSGLFFRLHMPIFYTRWNLGFCETNINSGSQEYVPGYFACSAVPNANLNQSFTQYARGMAPTFTDSTGPVIFNPLNFARIDSCSRSKFGVADLAFIFGYNFLNDQDYHVGLGLYGSAPTGTRPEARYLFEPIIGNGKHWAIGLHFTSHAILWRNCTEESNIGLYIDANVTHLMDAQQQRTFDLVGKPLSRYMLAERLGTPIVNGLQGDTTAVNSVFKNEFSPVANFTTQQVNVSMSVQGDLAMQFTYGYRGFSWDLGYNLWAISCEKITPICLTPAEQSCQNNQCNCGKPTDFSEKTWALKGDVQVYGYREGTVEPICIPLSATQTGDSLADITGGSNYYNFPNDFDSAITNEFIDNPILATALNDVAVRGPVTTTPGGATQINTSVQPIFITADNINNQQGTRGVTHKIYSNISYQWLECEDWVPYLGIGGFAELASESPRNNTLCSSVNGCTSICTSCMKCGVTQWGAWLKGGVSF